MRLPPIPFEVPPQTECRAGWWPRTLFESWILDSRPLTYGEFLAERCKVNSEIDDE